MLVMSSYDPDPEYDPVVIRNNRLHDPDPEYDPAVIRNNRLQSGCIFWQPADFSANSDGVIQPSAEWGRLWL